MEGINFMKSERGQALILIALGMAAFLALTALAIDGGMAFAERRSSQNAVDNAALAAAYSIVASGEDTAAARTQAEAAAGVIGDSNGFPGLADNVSFEVDAPDLIDACGVNEVGEPNGVDVTVALSTSTATSFGGIVGADNVESTVQAKTRVCFPRVESLFRGNAVVALDPNGEKNQGNSFDAVGGPSWVVKGGGILSNAGAYRNGASTVTAPSVVSVKPPQGFSVGTGSKKVGEVGTIPQIPYPPTDIKWPDTPACDVPAQKTGNTFSPQEADTQWTGNVITQSQFGDGGTFNPGLYCVTVSGNLNIHNDISGTGVTFYLQGAKYGIKFNGSEPGFNIVAPTDGPYKGIALFSPVNTSGMMDRKFELRGNGSASVVGSILLPSTLCDVRSNSVTDALRSQLICYQVTSGGGAWANIDYNKDENYLVPSPPIIELLE
jgi:Flp pilus assembly protein TadG